MQPHVIVNPPHSPPHAERTSAFWVDSMCVSISVFAEVLSCVLMYLPFSGLCKPAVVSILINDFYSSHLHFRILRYVL